MKRLFTLPTLSAALVAGGLLTACGGGSDDPAPLDVEVPVTAAATSGDFTAYAVAQVELDTTRPRSDPLNLDTVETPPSSETADPVDFD